MLWNEVSNQACVSNNTDTWFRLCNMQITAKHGIEGQLRDRPDTRIEQLTDADPGVRARLR